MQLPWERRWIKKNFIGIYIYIYIYIYIQQLRPVQTVMIVDDSR